MRAAEAAISNPLLEDTNMKGARGLLINITGGSDITLFEMDQAANRIREEVDEEANIMVGMALDESLTGRLRISVVATGIDSAAPSVGQMPKFQVVGGGMAEAVAFPPQAHAQNAPQGGQAQAAHAHAPAYEPQAMGPASQGGGYVPQPPTKPLLSAAYQAPLSESAELAFHEPEARPMQKAAPMQAAPMQAAPRQVAPEPGRVQAEAPKRASLFSRVFGGSTHAAPAPQRTMHQEPVMAPAAYRQEAMVPERQVEAGQQMVQPSRANVRPTQVDEIGLEIPAFLRRSSN